VRPLWPKLAFLPFVEVPLECKNDWTDFPWNGHPDVRSEEVFTHYDRREGVWSNSKYYFDGTYVGYIESVRIKPNYDYPYSTFERTTVRALVIGAVRQELTPIWKIVGMLHPPEEQ